VKMSNSTSFPSHAARTVTLPGAAPTQRLIGVTSAVPATFGYAFGDTDDATPGLPAWSPPLA